MNNAKPVRLHKKVTFEDKAEAFWNEYKGIIGLLIVTFCIGVLIVLILMATTKSGISFGHVVSSDANRYEHMNQIVTFYGGRF